MSNNGLFIDRNPDLRAAGKHTSLDPFSAGQCLQIYNEEELAKAWLICQCKHKKQTNRPLLLKRTPLGSDESVKDLLDVDRSKSRFTSFKEKFSEDMYFKKAKLGQTKPANSIPKELTNENQTFGKFSERSDPLYELVLPPKPPEEVNRECGYFHEKYLLSHNHYFPAEQVNRKYTPPFNRFNVFGQSYNVDDNGRFVKRCLSQCEELTIVSKTQMDFINRTRGPLGTKFKKYPYDVPQDMIHGVPSTRAKCDTKMLIENIDPCEENKILVEAFVHLNKLRRKVPELQDFHIHDLITVLESYDEDKKGQLPLRIVIDAMRGFHLRPDAEKIRIVLSHFNMLLDGDNVNFNDFASVLMVQKPLPKAGNISAMPKEVYNKETTYRLLCQDLKKTPNDAKVVHVHWTADDIDDARTHVVDLINPSTPTKLGLGQSDFEKLRDRQQIERIFHQIIPSVEEFDKYWNVAVSNYANQNGLISVNQFRAIAT